MPSPAAGNRSIAFARIVCGVFFLLFGHYKVFTDAFRGGGLQRAITSYLNEQSVAFYKPFLASVVQPHITAWAYIIGIGELLIGISLLIGLLVRVSSVFGAIHMLSLTLATWNGAGSSDYWRIAGNQLGHIPLLLLLVIFFFCDAGATWGLDGKLRRPGKRRR